MSAMLPEVNPLPGAQRQRPAPHRNAQVDRRQRGPHVRRHVILSIDYFFPTQAYFPGPAFLISLMLAPVL
jgi:hypothetical protein